MRRKQFTEEQIIGILKEAEAGGKATDLCRRHGISEQTFYRWKAEYGGLVADLILDNQALKDLVGRKG